MTDEISIDSRMIRTFNNEHKKILICPFCDRVFLTGRKGGGMVVVGAMRHWKACRKAEMERRGIKDDEPEYNVMCDSSQTTITSIADTPNLNLQAIPEPLAEKIVIKTSFDTVTKESAENGDFADHGWEDEDGVSLDDVDEAVRWLKDHGAMEASCSDKTISDVWYSTEPEMDMHTGESKTLHFHIKATDSTKKAIREKLGI